MINSQKTTEVEEIEQIDVTMEDGEEVVVVGSDNQYPNTASQFIDGVCQDLNEIADGVSDLAGKVATISLDTAVISAAAAGAWGMTYQATEKVAEQAMNAGNVAKGAVLYLFASVADNESEKAGQTAEESAELFADAEVVKVEAEVVKTLTKENPKQEKEKSWWPTLGW